jgi:hypothetical protein
MDYPKMSTDGHGNLLWFNHETEDRYIRVFYDFPEGPDAHPTGFIRWGLPLYVADGIWTWWVDFTFSDDGVVVFDPAGTQGPAKGQPCDLKGLWIIAMLGLSLIGQEACD